MKNPGHSIAAAGLLGLAATLLPHAGPAAVVLPVADTMVTEAPGLGGVVSSHGSDILLFATGMPAFRSYPLVRFDLSAFTGQTLTGPATFEFWLTEGAPTGLTSPVSVHAILRPWDEATETLQTFGGPLDINPGRVGPAVDTVPVTYSGTADQGFVSWSLPADLVQGWIDDPSSNFGLLIRNTATGPGTDLLFQSREGTHPPQLTFDMVVVPEPAEWGALAGLMLVGFATARRHRRPAA
ncbi:MAG: DNRLRE domain-containing protein [Limisphaerales bacterium]